MNCFKSPGTLQDHCSCLETASRFIVQHNRQSRKRDSSRVATTMTFDCSTTPADIRKQLLAGTSLGFALKKDRCVKSGRISWRRTASNKCSSCNKRVNGGIERKTVASQKFFDNKISHSSLSGNAIMPRKSTNERNAHSLDKNFNFLLCTRPISMPPH